MTEDLDFEARLERRLLARASGAARPFDAAVIARRAVVPARGTVSVPVGWQSLPRTLRWSVLALVLASTMLGALVVGRPLLERTTVPKTVSNGWVAFAVKGFERISDSDLWVVQPGSVDKLLIGFPGDNVRQSCPSFSPDGARIAYARIPMGMGDTSGDVVVVSFDSTKGEVGDELIPASRLGAGCPKWSPDGRSIAVEIEGHIWVIGLDGTSREVLTSADTAEGGMFDWSPAGTEIVVVVEAREKSVEGWITVNRLMVVPLAGGEPWVIHEEGADVSLYRPTWSPDGSRIAVEAARLVSVDEGYRLEELRVRVVAADGSAAPLELSDVNVDSPAWSPDGQRLAYHRTRLDSAGLTHREVVVTALGGGDPLVLARETGQIRGLSWAPDGKQVLYIVDARMTRSGLISVSIAGDGVPIALTGGLHEFYNATSDDISWQPVFIPVVGP